MFYSPVILSTLGMEPFINTAIVGAVNVVATLVAVALVDRTGRRPLFLFGGAQMAVSQAALAVLLGVFFKDGGGGGSSAASAAAALPKPVGIAVSPSSAPTSPPLRSRGGPWDGSSPPRSSLWRPAPSASRSTSRSTFCSPP